MILCLHKKSRVCKMFKEAQLTACFVFSLLSCGLEKWLCKMAASSNFYYYFTNDVHNIAI